LNIPLYCIVGDLVYYLDKLTFGPDKKIPNRSTLQLIYTCPGDYNPKLIFTPYYALWDLGLIDNFI